MEQGDRNMTQGAIEAGNRSFLRVFAGESLSVPPIWMMRQAGRYLPEYRKIRADAGSFLDLCYSPELASEVTLQPIRRYGFDAAIVFADILLVPDGLGQTVGFVEGEGPVLDAIAGRDDFSRLNKTGLHSCLAPVYETIARTRAALPSGVALIGFCGAPWTVATYMIGGRGSPDQKIARLAAYERSSWVIGLMDLLVDASAEYLCAQVEAGADALQIFDTWAGSLPKAEFDRWCMAPTAKLVSRVREKYPDVPIIGFPKGCGSSYQEFVAATGVSGVSFDSSVDMEWVAARFGGETVVQGNLDPLAVVGGGDALDDAVDRIMAAMAGKRFVFNLGHGLVPETPPDNVARVVERVRSGR